MPPKILKRCDLCKNWQAIYILNDPEHGKIKVCHKCWLARHHLSLPFQKENPPEPRPSEDPKTNGSS